MKTLKQLLENIHAIEILGDTSISISGLCFDSREVSQGSLFVAQRGTITNGHDFISKAVVQGAVAVVCEEIISPLPNITYIKVESSALALGNIANSFFDHPSRKLKLVGITGTNGKTTTATLLHALFMAMGYKTGLLSTIVNKINHEEIPSTHTTPDAVHLNTLLSKMAAAGCKYCFMEVSSHAIVQHRIAGLSFAGGVFSNITHDHLDFHKTFSAYIHAKKTFFDSLPSSAFALTNKDDKNGLVMIQNTGAKTYTYSLRTHADFHATIIENTIHGVEINLSDFGEVYTQLVGKFNAYNLLSIYATAVLCGIDKRKAAIHLSALKPARGRFERVIGKTQMAVVDYAHTPDALQNILETLNDVHAHMGKIITVVGCGGNRDPLKRPIMAAIAAKMSHLVILTTDNPRNEDPEAILDDMEKGISNNLRDKVLRITNRAEAIRTACKTATEKDIVLVAGKGHETYQEVNGIRHHFDDKEELSKWLR